MEEADGMAVILFVDFDGLIVPEGRLADEEFEEQNAERPPIDGDSMTCIGQR